jgi:hypothetical protein
MGGVCVWVSGSAANFAIRTLASSGASSASTFATPWNQGLTLVHFPAQLKRFLWNRECT